MIKLKYIGLIFLLSFSCFSQQGDSLNFSYWTPKNWLSGGKTKMKENINNFKFSQEQLNQLVNEINTSTVLGIYYKYNPKVHYGLIPTIKFYMRQNQSNNFDDFFFAVRRGIENVEPHVLNFKFVESPTTILIGKRKAFYASATYNLKVKTGEVAIVRTKFVAIPLGKKYLYLTLLDNDTEDCTVVFQKVIEKINIE